MEGAPRAPRRRSSCHAAARVGLDGNDRPGALLMREAGRLSLCSCHALDLKDFIAFSSSERQVQVWLFQFE